MGRKTKRPRCTEFGHGGHRAGECQLSRARGRGCPDCGHSRTHQNGLCDAEVGGLPCPCGEPIEQAEPLYYSTPVGPTEDLAALLDYIGVWRLLGSFGLGFLIAAGLVALHIYLNWEALCASY